MKKALACIFVAIVSFALAGTPAHAAQVSKPGTTLVKHKKHKKKHKKHKA